MGIRYEKIYISKYSIYHIEQPPYRFIWVKATLKWKKCPRTALIFFLNGKDGVILGPKLRHSAKLVLGLK